MPSQNQERFIRLVRHKAEYGPAAPKSALTPRHCESRAKWTLHDYVLWGLCGVLTLAYCAAVAWGLSR